MKTPVTYYGGKQNMIKHILPLIPKHKHYIEPFFGGGAVFFSKEPSQMETINDVSDFVITFFRQVKSNFNELKLLIVEKYIYDSRPLFLRDEKEDALFISERGKRIMGQSMLLRLNALVARTENTALQEKEIGLHTLRHSIATHLLANGMKLEKIKVFLGHSSLESTQIYTHILKENGYEYEDNY